MVSSAWKFPVSIPHLRFLRIRRLPPVLLVLFPWVHDVHESLGWVKKSTKKAIEIVDLPMKNGGSFHGFLYIYQRVSQKTGDTLVV